MNEDELEQLCLEWFRENGWDVVYGPDISPDSSNPKRSDYHDVVVTDRSNLDGQRFQTFYNA